jgi:hypothetical protein
MRGIGVHFEESLRGELPATLRFTVNFRDDNGHTLSSDVAIQHRGGHGPAVAAVPVGHQRASTAVPHREVRGGAGSGKPVEVTSRAAIEPSGRRE